AIANGSEDDMDISPPPSDAKANPTKPPKKKPSPKEPSRASSRTRNMQKPADSPISYGKPQLPAKRKRTKNIQVPGDSLDDGSIQVVRKPVPDIVKIPFINLTLEDT
ncbi:hypothetical protein C0991_005828, partial [Blastosporella zonata]